MNTHYYYCLVSEVKPEHYPMLFETAGEMLNGSTINNLDRILRYERNREFWDFFFIEPHKRGIPASHWNFGDEDYVKKTDAIYLFNPSLSLKEVLFLHSLET